MNKQKAVNQVLDLEFGDKTISSISELGGDGKDTFKISFEDSSIILNLCLDKRFETRFETEALVLEKINKASAVPAPEVFSEDITKERRSFMYFACENKPGYNPKGRFKYMPVEERQKILRDIGQYLGLQHRKIQFDSFGQLKSENQGNNLKVHRQDWENVILSIVDQFIQDIKWSCFKKLAPRAKQEIEENIGLISGKFQPVLVHNDYSCDNILLENGKISAILDWEMALSGHKEYDLFKAERRFVNKKFETPKIRKKMRRSLYEGYKSTNDLESGWRERKDFYQYLNAIEFLRVFHEVQKGLSHEETKKREKMYKSYIKSGI